MKQRRVVRNIAELRRCADPAVMLYMQEGSINAETRRYARMKARLIKKAGS